MSEDVKTEVLKNTQESLGKFIKKPALTDKLLKKPPFRFLHDVVTTTIRETGFLAGLYTENELQSDNIKDREMKIAFLQKLIDCVKLVTDKNISARPGKIVAGLEPTKTNELLQAIGFALKKKLDSSEVVAQLIQGNVEPTKTKTKTKDEKKTTKTKESKEKSDKLKQSPSTNSITPRGKKSDTKLNKKEDKPKTKESPRTKDDKQKIKESPRATKDQRSKTTTKKTEVKEVKKPKLSPKEKNDKQKEIQPEIVKTLQEPEEILETPIEIHIPDNLEKPAVFSAPEEIIDNLKIPNKEPEILEKPVEEVRIKTPKRSKSRREQPITPGPLEMPPEMLSKEPSKIEMSRPKTSLRPPSVRPSSARPGAPRLKDRNDIILPQDELIPMGKVNVIVENFSTQEEEEDNEETVVVESLPEIVFQEPPVKPDIDIPAEKGHLVAQILEQINDSSLEGHEPKKPVEIEWEGGGKRNREAASKEMEKLRDSIQTLTRAANPLGKLMNFLQEDIDSMRSELKMWIEVNDKLTGEIRTQEKLNDESIEPLKKQLNRLEDDILKQNEQISVTQANILKNEQKIKMLLTRDP